MGVLCAMACVTLIYLYGNTPPNAEHAELLASLGHVSRGNCQENEPVDEPVDVQAPVAAEAPVDVQAPVAVHQEPMRVCALADFILQALFDILLMVLTSFI